VNSLRLAGHRRGPPAKGELSGAELFAWTRFQEQQPLQDLAGHESKSQTWDPILPVQGVEDVELYRENLKTYGELLSKGDEIQTA